MADTDFFYTYFNEESVRIAEEYDMLEINVEHIGFDENMGDISMFEFIFRYNLYDEAIVFEIELREDDDGTGTFWYVDEDARSHWILEQIRRLAGECTEEERATLSTWGGCANLIVDDLAGKIDREGAHEIDIMFD